MSLQVNPWKNRWQQTRFKTLVALNPLARALLDSWPPNETQDKVPKKNQSSMHDRCCFIRELNAVNILSTMETSTWIFFGSCHLQTMYNTMHKNIIKMCDLFSVLGLT